MPESELGAPSPLLQGWLDRLCEAAAAGPVVDLACGRGRHALALAERGVDCVGIDRNAENLRWLSARAAQAGLPVSPVRADLETGTGLPLRPAGCAAVLVFRYLHRPLVREIEALLAPGGLLLYETFLVGQRALGFGPKRDEFLLREGELRSLFPSLEVLEYSEGVREELPRPEATARLVARRA